MNRRQEKQDKRNQKLVAVLDEHATDVAIIPAMADANLELRRQLGLVQPAVSQQLQGRQGKGATQTKNALEAPLIGQLVKAANALSLLYKKQGHLDRAQALHLRRSEYEKMSQPTLVSEAKEVADQVSAVIALLTPYGFKKASTTAPGDDEKLQAQVAAYAASIPGNRSAAGRGKVGTATVRTVFRGLDAYVDGDFRSAVELLVDDHPELYALLREAMRIDDTGDRKKPKGGGGPTPAPGA
jgi:hypothetical protein